MQAMRTRVTRVFLTSAMLVAVSALAHAQGADGGFVPAQRGEMSVALEPARVSRVPRIVAGALLLVIGLGAIGRWRARSEAATRTVEDRDRDA